MSPPARIGTTWPPCSPRSNATRSSIVPLTRTGERGARGTTTARLFGSVDDFGRSGQLGGLLRFLLGRFRLTLGWRLAVHRGRLGWCRGSRRLICAAGREDGEKG